MINAIKGNDKGEKKKKGRKDKLSEGEKKKGSKRKR